ncbi:ABC transporter family substrate-binding protein [Kitasatospora sp. HPMI-4]|uniref:ABC transporter family substrate-binding protein n=1 Tax=Kitasatospora sp. HPMI-4 TaxID=3448443 RepID=UPI003F1DBBC3
MRVPQVTAAALALMLSTALAGCSEDNAPPVPTAADLARADRSAVREGGTLRWAVDSVPATLNVFQPEATADSQLLAHALLPSLFRLDEHARPAADPDYLVSAQSTKAGHTPQVVTYRLNPKAAWSDGTPISAADFTAQWHALSGTAPAFHSDRPAGYAAIGSIEQGADAHEVKVTFKRPYGAWRALFSPLYPAASMGTPDAFNRPLTAETLRVSAAPFKVRSYDREAGKAALVRNVRWWGNPAKAEEIDFLATPANARLDALDQGKVDIAPLTSAIDHALADRSGAGALSSAGASAGASGSASAGDSASAAAHDSASASASDSDSASASETGPSASPKPSPSSASARPSRGTSASAAGSSSAKQSPAAPPAAAALVDASDQALHRAESMPGLTLHRAASPAFTQLTLNAARAPLTDTTVRQAVALAVDRGRIAKAALGPLGLPATPLGNHLLMADQDGYQDNSAAAGDEDTNAAKLLDRAGWKRTSSGRAKDGKQLVLTLLIPDGSATARRTADALTANLAEAGITLRSQPVPAEEFVRDHLATGDYDLALFSWPATGFPGAEERALYAKPQPGADGIPVVGRNYARVGTEEIDRLFDRAASELDPGAQRRLLQQADARIWQLAHSVPLYQRPDLVAVRDTVANAGAYGFAGPRFQDLGFRSAG